MRMICIDDKRSANFLQEGMIYDVKIVPCKYFKEGFGAEIEAYKKKFSGIPLWLTRFKPYRIILSSNIKVL